MSATPAPRWPRSVLVLVWVLSSALYAGTSTLIFHSFVVTSMDNAIIEQVVARFSRLSAPISEVEGHGVNFFGDHFSPVLALYAPFYRLVPEPETLFVVQGGVLALSVVVVLVTATRHLGRPAGAAVAALYALSFGLLNATVMSARETPFAVLLLAVAGASHLAGSVRGVVLASLGLLLVKEDLGLTVAAIGFVLALEARSRRAGVALMGVGLAAFVLVIGVIIPSFRDGERSRYVTSPEAMLAATLDGWEIKALTLILTFGVAGLLCLRSRWSVITLPTFAWRFTSPTVVYWTPLAHYSAVLMPVVFVATIAVLRNAPTRVRVGALVIGSALTATTVSWAVSLAIPVVESYASDRHDSARRALRAIPAGASVVSDQDLVGHLAGDRTTYYIVYFGGCPRADYVVARLGAAEPNIWGGRLDFDHFEDAAELVDFADAAYGGTHEVVSDDGVYAVLRRVEVDTPEPCVPTDAGADRVGIDSSP